jgi:hypothetical protein
MALPEKCADLTAAAWISGNTSTLQPTCSDWKGNFVSHCVPTIYPAYCKVFHPIYEDLSVADRDIPWNDLKPLLSNPKEPLDRLLNDVTLVYGGEYDTGDLRPMSWRQLAQRYGLEFHPELNASSFTRNFPGDSWPRYLIGPDEGTVRLDTLKQIVRAIALVTSDFDLAQPCYFHYDLIATAAVCEDLLFYGKLIDVFDTRALDDVNTTPTNWWPRDKGWFVSTDWDLTFSLIGGPDELIKSLTANAEIDCVEVTPETRIDYKSDQLNP